MRRFQKHKKSVQWAITLVCVLGILWFFKKNSEKLALFLEIDAVCIVKLVALILAAFFVHTFRFQLVLEKCGERKVPLFKLYRIIIVGRYLSTFIPQAGNVYRGVTLKSEHGISYTRYASSFLAFNWLEICFNLLLALAVNATLNPSFRIGNFRVSFVLGGIFLFVAIIPILMRTLLGFVRFRNSRVAWIRDKLFEMFSVILKSLSDRRFLLKFIVSGIIAFAVSIAIFHVSFSAIDSRAELSILVFFCVVLQFFNQIIITPGNMGVKEIVYGIISDQTNIGPAEGIIVSVVIRMTSTILLLIMGTVFGGFGLLINDTRKEERNSN